MRGLNKSFNDLQRKGKKSIGNSPVSGTRQQDIQGSLSSMQEEIFICDQTMVNERKKNYERKKKELFRKVFRDQLIEKLNNSYEQEI